MGRKAKETKIRCPKCHAYSGDDWSRCGGICPMPMSPHYQWLENEVAQRIVDTDATEIKVDGAWVLVP